MTRLGIFGGTFNPIHAAHLILAERARDERALDKVLFIPALLPPHKPQEPLAPSADRLRMVELAVEGNPAFEALPLELEREGPSYTLLTVRELRGRFGAAVQLFLLLGADSVRDMPTWWRAQDLVRTVDIIAFDRPGHSLDRAVDQLAALFGEDWARRVRNLKVSAPLLDISASEIRQRVAAGRSIRYLVPEPVRKYILERGLYRP
jgi:nicotinate-nucleotide adenylyltransferase